jgi:hypothetical protein
MKTLRDYVVTNALFQADTGPEAQVGDQIRLYLDTEANPGFPEYVVGVIQHPISKVNCDSATSYVVEYDEADLDGAAALLRSQDVIDGVVVTATEVLDAALTAEIAARVAHETDTAGAHAATAISNTPAGSIAATTVQAAINELDTDVTTEVAARIAADATKQPLDSDLTAYAGAADAAARRALIGAVGTALEITTALKGAENDAAKIGTEYMPDDLEVDTLQLADQSSVVLAAGQVALDDNGRVIVGNGSKNQEVGSSSRFHVRNVIHVDTATVTGGATFQRIGVFKLRADEWVLGQRAMLIGSVGAVASSAYAGNAYVGVRPVGSTASGFRDSSNITGASGTAGITQFMAFVQFKAASAGSNIVIDEDVPADTVLGIRTRYDSVSSAGVVTTASSTASNLGANGNLPAVATDLEVYINLPQDAGFTGYVRAFADLELILL